MYYNYRTKFYKSNLLFYIIIVVQNKTVTTDYWKKYRYIRRATQRNSKNNSTHYIQIKAFVWTTNVALNKTASVVYWTRESSPSTNINRITNWNSSDWNNYCWFSNASQVQVDLWDLYKLNTITRRNYFWDSRIYYGVLIQCSKDWITRDTYRDTNVDWTFYESSSWKTITIQ